MKSKRLFQILVLLALLFSPFGSNQPARASTGLVERPNALTIHHNFSAPRDIIQTQPTISMVVSPSSINVGGTATVTVNLDNVPAEGYTSVELTCTYYPDLVEARNIIVGDLFGADPVTAISGPQYDRFIVAIAGSDGNKATNSGAVLAFNVRGLQAGQSPLECQARVSKGDNALTTIASTGTNVIILGNTPTPTVDPAFCDKVQLIADVTVPDGTSFAPGATFTKTWRLKNAGSCAWSTAYQIVFYSGEQMGAVSSASFPRDVAPGQVVDISLNLTAPSVTGSYRGYWMFKNANGALFGMGPQANIPWWVDIRVSGPTATATPTIKPAPCDKAEFIADINVPPGTVMPPGMQFIKTWRFKNVGTCVWTTSYRVALLSGEQMGAPSSVGFPVNVAPGQMIDVSLSMTAPSVAGSYRGYWIFQNVTGALFGVGSQGNEPWFVDIVVSNTSTSTPTFTDTPSVTPDEPGNSPTPSMTPGGPTATPIPGSVYDFATNACVATWFSGAGQLPCPGIDGDARGFVLKVSHPRLETGEIDTRPGLITFPQNVQNGYIQGFYPPFHVQYGDRFRSIIGCEGGATNCYVAFRLDYQTGTDPIKTFWGPFLERYEGRPFSVDVNLSSLAGKDVKFILTVLSAGVATGDRALWVGPSIYRSDLIPTPTSETTETPTPTSSDEPPVPTFTPTPGPSPTPTSTPVPTTGTVTGQVLAGKPVILDLFDADNWPVAVAYANMDGTFSLTAPAGTYNLVARAPGFLSAMGPVTITAGGVSTKPTITLLPGDIDSNFVIDWLDAVTIGMNYNTSYPSAADLNNDGIINVLDLELLARNYRKTGPVVWQ